MKKIIILLVFTLILAGTAFFIVKRKSSGEVVIRSKNFKVEIAATEPQRQKGLSGRESLDYDSGMLFVFPKSIKQSFWMKDTLIPLDIIWINNGKIVDMTTLDPETDDYTPSYSPKDEANYVLEINAGIAAENGFKVGDEVKISL